MKVMTHQGFRSFSGIRKTFKTVIRLVFENGSDLICTPDHPLLTDKGELQSIDISDEMIKTTDGWTRLVSVHPIKEPQVVYDLLDVESGWYLTNDIVSHNCEVLGSSNTLIEADTLHRLVWETPIKETEIDPGSLLRVWSMPSESKRYLVSCDVAEGSGNDNTVIQIIDITQIPYRQIAVYSSNKISPSLLPQILVDLGNHYNQAYMIIESNSVGSMVSQSVHSDYDYPSMISSKKTDPEKISEFSQKPGIRTTTKTKSIGCSQLKLLIEKNHLILQDENTISELMTFIRVRNSYQAEKGKKDDRVMSLVFFAWLTSQEFFKDLSETDVSDFIRKQQEFELPVGFFADGSESDFD